MTNTIVPPGISGRPAYYHSDNVSLENIANELTLSNLGVFEPLKWKIDCTKFMQEISKYENDWQDYLPRTDRPNNRKSLTLTCLPGTDYRTNPSLAQASIAAKRRLSELEFNQKTEVYEHCSSLRPFLDKFMPLGRTFLIRTDIGGYFVPHRDHPSMPRDVFRLIVFLNNCGPLDYDWLMGDKKLNIEHGRAYYLNTRMTHRTISWIDNSIHLILNVPMTTENVAKVVSNLQHTH
jgi:hypothetical protein